MDGERFMKRRMILGEKGVFSVFGICALGTLLFLSAALYAVCASHMSAERRFLARTALRNAAEDGVRLAVSRMNSEAGVSAKAEAAVLKHAQLFDGASGDAKYKVYARSKDGKILLLSVGERGEERARVIGVAEKKDGKYSIDHWEY
jgi:hypothetical protein